VFLERDLVAALDICGLFKRVIGGDPDPWQTDILLNDPSHLIALCSRQAGKSSFSQVRAIHEALYNPGSLTLLVSAGLRQASELFRGVANGIHEVCPDRGAVTMESVLRLELSNGSRVIALPASESTARGWSRCSLLIIDEAAAVEPAINKPVLPTTAAMPDARIYLLSTPGGKVGTGEFFYRQWTEGGRDWHKVLVTAKDCPRLDPEYIKRQSRIIGARAAEAEFMCQFLELGDSLFTVEALERCVDPNVKATNYGARFASYATA
jgi:hypothetical protein